MYHSTGEFFGFLCNDHYEKIVLHKLVVNYAYGTQNDKHSMRWRDYWSVGDCV